MNLVFLGCGRAAAMHARTLARIGGVTLGFASRTRERADSYRRRFGAREAFGSYEEAVAHPSVDVAVITTPTAEHLHLAELALSAGKHVIVEKPAFMSVDEADRVRACAESAGRSVMVAENYAYKPILAFLRRQIESGALGELRFVTLNATKRQHSGDWRSDAQLSGGGALFEGGVHWVSFAASLGLEIEGVHAFHAGPGRGADESTVVVFEYANGAVGTLTHSWEIEAPLGGLRLSKVQGTRGAVTFESNGLAAYVSGARRSARLFLRDPLGYSAMFRDFLDSLRAGGRREPRFTLPMARRDLALLEALSLGSAVPL
ncbi:MAG TPA: Gfo/Idh/MocA family oxidoreductase [Gemmatimonadaceae bacterium]|nr:Gfo/Idh/MocA family oxidoreductase [Gemmatimonadaceae bacterium]